LPNESIIISKPALKSGTAPVPDTGTILHRDRMRARARSGADHACHLAHAAQGTASYTDRPADLLPQGVGARVA
jgi:hypothetical protein